MISIVIRKKLEYTFIKVKWSQVQILNYYYFLCYLLWLLSACLISVKLWKIKEINQSSIIHWLKIIIFGIGRFFQFYYYCILFFNLIHFNNRVTLNPLKFQSCVHIKNPNLFLTVHNKTYSLHNPATYHDVSYPSPYLQVFSAP